MADVMAFRSEALKGIDEACFKYNDGHRNHLGASLIGKPCLRQLWYIFRWSKSANHSPRTLRLFNRGHKEEARFSEWLRNSGWIVDELDPETGKQWRFSALNGHFGCSLDGIATPPDHLLKHLDEGERRVLLEYKTSGTGKKFNDTRTLGMPNAKPEHWAQTCVGGFGYQLLHCWYMIINKNDDDLEGQLVTLSYVHAQTMIAKAEYIINSPTPPKRISENPAYFDCKYCNFQDICHHGELPETNCRSCTFATPVENGQWKCSIFNDIIPPHFIPKACPKWEPAL